MILNIPNTGTIIPLHGSDNDDDNMNWKDLVIICLIVFTCSILFYYFLLKIN